MRNWKEEIEKHLSQLQIEPTREAEIVEELSQHLDDCYEQYLQSGATEEEAYQQTLLELKGSDFLFAEELRKVERSVWQPKNESKTPEARRRINMLGDFRQDLQFGLRMLVKNPAFTIIVVITLALGIGANSAIFSVINTVLLRPLPYKDPDRLVMVWEDVPKMGFPRNTPAPANFIDWRNQNKVFEGMAAVAVLSINLTGIGEPERIDGLGVSGNFFSLLGVEPQLGRTFLPEEDQHGANRVVIISQGLWQRRFNSDNNIIGKTLTLNGESFQVIGVMPSQFKFPSRESELWVPIAFDPEEASNRGGHYLQVIARLKPGVTVQQAHSDMNTIAARLEQQYPETNTGVGSAVIPLHEQFVGDIKPALLLLLGAVGFVLLVACANVANLLLARAAARQKEIALRMAIGASRLRLIRQFLTESILIAAIGGSVGLLVSIIGVNLLKAFIPGNISQAQAITIDVKVLIFTLFVSLLTGLIFGLAPALQTSNFNLNETLKEGKGAMAGSGNNRIRSLLVITEIAFSLILLMGAGLLINSFLRLRNVDPGFRSDNLLTMKVELPESKYPDKTRRSAFYTDLVHRVESLPGVRSAAVATNLPLTYNGDSIPIGVEGRPDPAPDQRPDVVTRIISPDYFRTMSIRLLKGREFSEQEERENSTRVAIISETMARRLWQDEDPIGKRIKPGSTASTYPWISIIGVAKDVRQFELSSDPRLQMYLPYTQASFFEPRALVVSTNVEPSSLSATVRRTVWEIDKDQPVSNISTMEDIIYESVARQRFSTFLLCIFAAIAMTLAAVGIYGIMSYSVTQRTHEMGIRMALGAQKSDVLKLAIGQGLKLIVIGVVIGLAAAFFLTRLMSSLLFGVSATDPATFIVISLVLVSVGLFASYIPARRATKVDPMITLRHD